MMINFVFTPPTCLPPIRPIWMTCHLLEFESMSNKFVFNWSTQPPLMYVFPFDICMTRRMRYCLAEGYRLLDRRWLRASKDASQASTLLTTLIQYSTKERIVGKNKTCNVLFFKSLVTLMHVMSPPVLGTTPGSHEGSEAIHIRFWFGDIGSTKFAGRVPEPR